MSTPIYGPARAVPLTIRCSVEQHQAFRTAALADGRSLTDWAVRALEATIRLNALYGGLCVEGGARNRRPGRCPAPTGTSPAGLEAPEAMPTMPAQPTDPSLWIERRVFGVAGGPLEIALTTEGEERAFAAGAQIRRGREVAALRELGATPGGEGYLSERVEGTARIRPTALGRYDNIVWGYLRAKGYVESIAPDHSPGGHLDGVRLTPRGIEAIHDGYREMESLLSRCYRAAWGVE